jgi:hypothetical protein
MLSAENQGRGKNMLKRRLMYILTIILAVIIAFPSGSSGQVDEKLRDDCAAVLVRLKIMQGGTGGNLRLDDPITRSEFVTLVIRMMGWDYDTELDGIGLAFSDSGQIQGWAENYIKIALKYNLIKGYNTGNTVELRPNRVVTTAEALAILIRALGYESTVEGGWPDGVMNKALAIGLRKNIDLPPAHNLTRGESAVLIFNALTVDYYR